MELKTKNMKAKTHGGKRSKAGRKHVNPADKKVGLTVYIAQSNIDNIGGMDSAREKVINFLSEKT